MAGRINTGLVAAGLLNLGCKTGTQQIRLLQVCPRLRLASERTRHVFTFINSECWVSRKTNRRRSMSNSELRRGQSHHVPSLKLRFRRLCRIAAQCGYSGSSRGSAARLAVTTTCETSLSGLCDFQSTSERCVASRDDSDDSDGSDDDDDDSNRSHPA